MTFSWCTKNGIQFNLQKTKVMHINLGIKDDEHNLPLRRVCVTHEFAVIHIPRRSRGINANKWVTAHNTRVGVVYLTYTTLRMRTIFAA